MDRKDKLPFALRLIRDSAPSSITDRKPYVSLDRSEPSKFRIFDYTRNSIAAD